MPAPPASATAHASARTRRAIAAIGEVDELNSVVGVLLSEELPLPIRECLISVQHDLFDLGGELSIPGYTAVSDAHAARLEADVERFNADLAPLKEFILPGGRRAAASAHVGRTVCRRAERALVASLSRRRCPTRPGATSTDFPICCSCWRAGSTRTLAVATCCGKRSGLPGRRRPRDRCRPPFSRASRDCRGFRFHAPRSPPVRERRRP